MRVHVPDHEEVARMQVTLPQAQQVRGIYLRRADETDRPAQVLVRVAPVFPHPAGDADAHHGARIALEQRVALTSTQPWITAPQHLLLIHNGRQFTVRVDPTALPHGAHYGEVHGVDMDHPERCVSPLCCPPPFTLSHARTHTRSCCTCLFRLCRGYAPG
jgi:hypothetical protein